MSDFICIGHRGARGHEPENTLRSVRKGFELGAQGVEIDVWLVQGELLVIHDRTLQRTTNGRGVLTRKSLAELRQLDAGQGEKIPTLREVFEASLGKGFVNVELKGPDTAEPVLRLIDEFVNRHGARREDFLLSSFRRSELRKAAHREVRIGLLYSRPTPLYYLTALRLGVWSVHPAASAVSRRSHATSCRESSTDRREYSSVPRRNSEYRVSTPSTICKQGTARKRALSRRPR